MPRVAQYREPRLVECCDLDQWPFESLRPVVAVAFAAADDDDDIAATFLFGRFAAAAAAEAAAAAAAEAIE